MASNHTQKADINVIYRTQMFPLIMGGRAPTNEAKC